MDIQNLLAETKARFSHNSHKESLREKYSNKNLVAEQGGLWRADATTIAVLQSFDTDKIILLDTYNNPVEVDRSSLLEKLKIVYTSVMQDYYKDFKEAESKR